MISSIRHHSLLYLLSLIIIVLTVSLIIAGSLIAHNQQLSLTATTQAIETFNNQAIINLNLCGEISRLTRSTSPCDGIFVDAWSPTPSASPLGVSTFSGAQLTATEMPIDRKLP